MLSLSSYPLDRYLWDRSRGRSRLNQQFFYQGEVTFVAATTGDQSVAIDTDTDAPFVWIGLRAAQFFSSGGSVSLPIDPLDAAVMVRYGGRGARGFAQTPVDIRNCVAPRPIPFVLPCPKVLAPGAELFITVTLRTAQPGGNVNVALQFYGFKAYTVKGGQG